jgi:hypothetical protein
MKRFRLHWKELRTHLRDERDVSSEVRQLEPRATEPEAVRVALDETKHVFDMELSGSGSLNTRGTQLAGLAGATIALVGTVAQKWLSATHGGTRVAIGVLVILSMLALFGAMYCAIFAVLPTSKWRRKVEDLIGKDLGGTTAETSDEELRSAIATRYLRMAEDQRVRNQAKADDMLLSYGFLGAGVAALLIAATLFVISDTAATSKPTPSCTCQRVAPIVGPRGPRGHVGPRGARGPRGPRG